MRNFFSHGSRIAFILIATAPVASAQTGARPGGDPSGTAETAALKQKLREDLSPAIRALLAEQCGDDCPGFRLEPIFKSKASRSDSLEDLGFTRSAGSFAPAPELASVEAIVLIQDGVPQASRDSLKQAVAHRLSNDAGVPASVQLKPLSAVLPAAARRLEAEKAASRAPVLAYVSALAWPAAILGVALLALGALGLALRSRRTLLRERLAAREAAGKAAVGLSLGDGRNPRLEGEWRRLLELRAADLEWLIADRAHLADSEALKRVLRVFPATELSSRLALGGETLAAVAAVRLTDGSKGLDEAESDLAWLEGALDQAHWKRLEEDRNPFLKLDRLSDSILFAVYSELPSQGERALLVSELNQRRWPALLGRLGAEDRVALGVELGRLENSPLERVEVHKRVAARFLRPLDRAALSPKDLPLVEDYSLYLPDKEGQALWASVRGSQNNPGVSRVSVEGLLETLGAEELVEICMRLELKHLQLLLAQAKPVVRARVLAALPVKLRERAAARASRMTDAASELFAARAGLLGAYRSLPGIELGPTAVRGTDALDKGTPTRVLQ